MYHYLQIPRYGSLDHPLLPGLRLPLYGFSMYHYLQIPRYGSLNHPLRRCVYHFMGSSCTTISKFSATGH